MQAFLQIFFDIALPIFILIGIGFGARKIFFIDLKSLTKLNVYVFVPPVLFVKIYETRVTFGLFVAVAGFVLAICLIMYVLSLVVSRLFKYPAGEKIAFTNAMLFFNSGNYGLPLVALAFNGNPLAMTVQIFIMLVQNVLTNTLGVFNASSSGKDYKRALKNVFMMPSIYVIFAVIIVKGLNVSIPGPIMAPLESITNAFIAVALVTLGVSLAEVKIRFDLRNIITASLIRLVIAPLAAFFLVNLMGLEGILAKALILGVSTPSAVTTAIIAKEFDNKPEFASEAVFFTTLISSITIPVIIYLLG